MDPLVTGYKRRSGGLLEMFYKFSVVWADVFISQVTKIKVDLAEVAGVALRTRNFLAFINWRNFCVLSAPLVHF
jgi:hypothetical protein